MTAKLPSWLILTLLTGAPCSQAAQAPLLLADMEARALASSPRVKALTHEARAFEERAAAQHALCYPTLSIDGTYRYLTHVQEIALPIPGASPIKFGDNNNYAIGPQLHWILWNHGGIDSTINSMEASAQGKRAQTTAAQRQLILAVRAAYFQVVLAQEQVTLYTDALKLTQAQYDDIRLNAAAGTKSLAEKLKAHQEVITRMKQLTQAQADMDIDLQDLSALVGTAYPSAPLERIDDLLTAFQRFANTSLNEHHPALVAYRRAAEASAYAKDAAHAQRWPQLTLSARSSWEYPDGVIQEQYIQNSIGAGLHWPIFESGASTNRIREQEYTRQAHLQHEAQLHTDLQRDWLKTVRQLENLQKQRTLNNIAIEETEQLAGIIYKTYQTGSVAYLEVENANFKALEAKIQAARTKVQILMHLAVLASMAE